MITIAKMLGGAGSDWPCLLDHGVCEELLRQVPRAASNEHRLRLLAEALGLLGHGASATSNANGRPVTPRSRVSALDNGDLGASLSFGCARQILVYRHPAVVDMCRPALCFNFPPHPLPAHPQ
jgi:hypothetical protein